MAKRAFLWLGLLTAVAAFAVANGWSDYQTARSVKTYIVVNGVERELTPSELVSSFLIGDSVRTVPIGVIAVTLLYLPLRRVARGLKFLPKLVAVPAGMMIGVAIGGFISFVVWVLLGGWGPPLLLPSVVAGAILTGVLVAYSPRPAEAKPDAVSEPDRGGRNM
jgi:hypothetical protein